MEWQFAIAKHVSLVGISGFSGRMCKIFSVYSFKRVQELEVIQIYLGLA
jgi:hypothetical protein